MANVESNKISYLHFIMSVLVILIHSINNETKFERFFSMEYGIGQFAVPLFFMISGFLFFRNVSSMTDVKNKLKKRFHTLLIPYMLWNFIYYAIHLLLKPGNGLDIYELYNAVFNYSYNPAFWYVYQLILLSIASIVFIYILKEKKYIIIFYIIMLAMILIDIDIPYINEDAIIYYFTGATFNKLYEKRKIDFINKKYFIFALIISIMSFILNRFAYHLVTNSLSFRTLFVLSIIVVRLSISFLIFYLCDIIFNYRTVPKFMNHTFFLYAIHYAIVKAMIIFMRYISYKYLPASTFLSIEIIVFVLSPVVCVIVNYYLSNYMIKNFNEAYNVLVGNR